MVFSSSLQRNGPSVGLFILASASVALGTFVIAPLLRRVAVRRQKKQEDDAEGDGLEQEFGILLFYEYAAILQVPATIKLFEELCQRLDLRGRLRISEEGFNGNLSGRMEACQAFIQAVRADFAELRDTDFKLARCSAKHLFHNLKVWASDEVCGLFAAQDGSERAIAARSLVQAERGQHLSPQEWHEMMQNAGDDVVLFDVRNRYETRIGRFARNQNHSKAQGVVTSDKDLDLIDPNTRFFHEVPEYLSLDENIDRFRGKKVMMYCTGGVRCERASALLKQHLGDEADIYQLAGGIQRYLEAHPDGGYFEGSMHVFDRREHVSALDCAAHCSDIGSTPQPVKVIGSCIVCNKPWENYQGKWRCGECSLLILICSRCQGHYSSKSKRDSLRCELCEEKVSAEIVERPVLGVDSKIHTKAVAIPPGLTSFGQRARELMRAYDDSQALSELLELLKWLNSRRLRMKFMEDVSALRAIRDFYLQACQQNQVDVAVKCAEVAEKLLRDQASRNMVWRELRPDEMSGCLLSLRQQRTVDSDRVALQILWRLVEVTDARSALGRCCTFLQSTLIDMLQRYRQDFSILRDICTVIRYFVEHADLRSLLCSNVEMCGTMARIITEVAEESCVGTAGELAVAVVSALAMFSKYDAMVLLEMRPRIRVVAKRLLEMHGKVANVKKWANLLLDDESGIENGQTKNVDATKAEVASNSLRPAQLASLKLADLTKVELLQLETTARVQEIWLERFSSTSNTVAGVMAKEEFDAFRRASSTCPTFLAPVHRSGGLVNFVWQCQNGNVYFQALESLKARSADAGCGRADLVLTLLPELLESHGLVLIYGRLCSDLISRDEAIGLVRFFRSAYSLPKWLHWVRQFNLSPSSFDADAFLAEFMQTR